MNIDSSEVVSRYLAGETSTMIAKVAGVTDRQIRRVLNREGVKIAHKRRPPIYRARSDFFKHWSPEMAYVLGFIVTDGCVKGNSVTVAQKERYILERIADAIGSDAPIREIPNGPRTIHTLQISRKEIVEDLRKLGVTERKSLIVPFPDVPGEMFPHFLRGVIDGDGWVDARGYSANVTTGSRLFADGLHTRLIERGFNARITKEKYRDIYRVWISGKQDISRLGRLIYDGSGDLFLQRKRERFEVHNAA